MREINLIDLFSGIGGFALGFERAGVKFHYHAFSEIEKSAINIYKKHFPNAEGLGDVRAIRDVSAIKKRLGGVWTVVCFGFPCQDLSVAGQKRGLKGDRSGLFFEAIRLIRKLKPQYFIFENVKGLLTNNRGADFIRCLKEIADLGCYGGQWQLVNTSWFLPQNRERIYFIGHLRENGFKPVFPITGSMQKIDELSSDLAQTLTTEQYSKIRGGTLIVESKQLQKVCQINQTEKNHQQDRVYCANGIAPTLNTGTGGNLQPKIIMPVLTPDRLKKRQNGRRFKANGEPSFTLTTQDRHGIYDGQAIRKLTPLECERLQGFPDNWTAVGADNKTISDSARYKVIGNAVSVPIPEYIAKSLFN